ncbi:MAG: sel1 repeat family protein [Polyangiaceae bacterium]|nr:sel1 repeat family protein [Polyangiaceae bacterium]MCL4755755.1 hypothetical protein [Myxococcales bacterium]
MADPGLSKPKLALGVLLWLASLAAATLPAIVVSLLDTPGGPLATHTVAFGVLTVVAGVGQLWSGVLALRGRRLPGVLLWGPALLPWAYVSALAAWHSRVVIPTTNVATLLSRGAYASGGLLFGVTVVAGLALSREPPGAARTPARVSLALGLGVVVGSAPAVELVWRLLSRFSIREHDSFVFFLPAWLITAILVLSLRRRAAQAAPGAAGLVSAFLLALWAPLLWGFASCLGALGDTSYALEPYGTPLPEVIGALRARCVALLCHTFAAALFFAVAFGALPAPRSRWLGKSAVSRASFGLVLALLSLASGAFARGLNSRLAMSPHFKGLPHSPTPIGMALSRTPPPTLSLEKEAPAAPQYPYAFPLEPENVRPTVPTDADRLMAEAREPPPEVPELPQKLPEPLPRFDRECQAGNGQSCASLAWLVSEVSLTRAPLVLAASLLDRGCRAGSHTACGRLGVALLRSWGVLEDTARGLGLLETACAEGSFDACGRLGTELAWGKYVAPDWERGRRLLNQACSERVWHACAVLARTTPSHFLSELERGTLDRKSNQAAASACAAGDVESCAFLDYRTPGNIPGGVSVYDLARRRWAGWPECQKELPLTCELARMSERMNASPLSTACRTGSLVACTTWVQESKPGTAERRRRASAACELGHPLHCAELASPTTPEGVRTLETACPSVALSLERSELDLTACEGAARAYHEGKLVPKSIGRALELYRRGCWDAPRYPNHAACVAMADIFMNGDGVTRDLGRALQILASDCAVDGRKSCARVAEHLERTAPDDESEERKKWRGYYRRRAE